MNNPFKLYVLSRKSISEGMHLTLRGVSAPPCRRIPCKAARYCDSAHFARVPTQRRYSNNPQFETLINLGTVGGSRAILVDEPVTTLPIEFSPVNAALSRPSRVGPAAEISGPVRRGAIVDPRVAQPLASLNASGDAGQRLQFQECHLSRSWRSGAVERQSADFFMIALQFVFRSRRRPLGSKKLGSWRQLSKY